jgi:hypothetical protein
MFSGSAKSKEWSIPAYILMVLLADVGVGHLVRAAMQDEERPSRLSSSSVARSSSTTVPSLGRPLYRTGLRAAMTR